MSDLVLYNDELITFQNPDGINVYTLSGDLELIGSATGYPSKEIVNPEIASVPPKRNYWEYWDVGNIPEEYTNLYVLKVNYCESNKDVGPFGSSGTGKRIVTPTGTTLEDYTGKVKEGSYLNLHYNDSANLHFNLDWSAVLIPCDAYVTYGTYTYVYGGTDFMSNSASTSVTADYIYTSRFNPSGNIYDGGWSIPVEPSSYHSAYDCKMAITETRPIYAEYTEIGRRYISALENYQKVRMPIYVYQIFGASNSESYEKYTGITASGGTPAHDYSYSALKMWAGTWSATISATDVPEFIVY